MPLNTASMRTSCSVITKLHDVASARNCESRIANCDPNRGDELGRFNGYHAASNESGMNLGIVTLPGGVEGATAVQRTAKHAPMTSEAG
jgi:hypothetical protein